MSSFTTQTCFNRRGDYSDFALGPSPWGAKKAKRVRKLHENHVYIRQPYVFEKIALPRPGASSLYGRIEAP